MLRSLLYVPAHSERFTAKAHERGADAVILDLEDSVPLTEKANARAALASAVPSVGQGGAKVFVRVNGAEAVEDIAAARAAGAFGLMVPKVQSSAQLDALPDLPLIALLEDAGAVLDARAIAAHPRVMALALGGEDLATEMGARPLPKVLHFPKLMLHYAAKAEGKLSLGLLQSIADYSDLDRLREAAAEAREFGFDGATCVHPSAVAVLNDAFGPSAEDVDWARRVIDAAEEAERDGKGATVLDGRMVDRPVVARARRILGL